MDTDWIGRHALSLWAGLLIVALVGADLAWRRAVRRRESLDAAARSFLRPVTAVAVTVVMLLIASAVAVEIRGQAGLAAFDARLAADLRADMPLPVLRGVAWITHAGDPLVVGTAAVLVFLALLVRRHGHLALAWAATLLGTAAINSMLKAWFQRERPVHDHGFVVEHSYSFPSGHASGATVFYGMLAYVLLVLVPARWHRTIVILAVALVTLVGVSRILLQVHYFSDVLAGYATGLARVTLCVGGAEHLRMRRGGQARA